MLKAIKPKPMVALLFKLMKRLKALFSISSLSEAILTQLEKCITVNLCK